MSRLFDTEDVRDVDEDARREAIDERARRRRLHHWCDVCHGHTGPGSPCHEPEPGEDDAA